MVILPFISRLLFNRKFSKTQVPELRTLTKREIDSLNSSLNELSGEKLQRFNHFLMDCYHDRGWCEMNQISYVHPDRNVMKQSAYDFLFKDFK
ncbi:hypothetical protein HN832_04420 [archaeon]|jgi:hypothetical protein|nr:hypothetical protein [archaeon]MBT4373362.1 hypothetical protein [archaeon]MBT4531810.1 hypothetical protein [archaeon]MBT7001477.1 hypothetical protein [archaeon]MBT7282631.1 hypothetical protein [archaeon]